MLPVEDRCFVEHAKGLFKPERIVEVHAHFNAVEATGQSQISSDRDRERVRMGATTDALRFDPAWYLPWQDLPEHTVAHLRPFTFLLYPVQIRHMHQQDHLVPWHQDLAYAKLMGERGHKQLITCFTPMEPEPSKTATVEFALPEEGESFPFIPHEPKSFHGAVIDGDQFANRVRFSLNAGDALLFGDHAPHRGVPGPNNALDRRSFEYRLIRPEDRIPNKDYFDIELGGFVRTDADGKVTPHES